MASQREPQDMNASTALFTDRYELTMVEGALASGVADQQVCFEVFSRRIPPGRRFGVFAGLGRLLPALEQFRFTPGQVEWLLKERVVDQRTASWLEGFRFSGDIESYAEGECFTVGSPVLTVRGSFAEAVLLETLLLSILNHDSAVAAAAAVISEAAGERPVIEMGSRRTDTESAVAAARAAYLAGFASTSNLEAGRRWAIPTAGTAAHAFVLAHKDEEEAFAAQVRTLGPETTLLVDTYDVTAAIDTAVEVAGPRLGAVRIDSGDLPESARLARKQLDSLGATGTRIVVTGDLDDQLLSRLADVPVDGYGVGTNVVTGLGYPTAGFVYKLVEVEREGARVPVSKLSPGKENVGGRKRAWRIHLEDVPAGAEAPQGDAQAPAWQGPCWADLVMPLDDGTGPGPDARPLQETVVSGGEIRDLPSLVTSRAAHLERRIAPGHGPLVLLREPPH